MAQAIPGAPKVLLRTGKGQGGVAKTTAGQAGVFLVNSAKGFEHNI